MTGVVDVHTHVVPEAIPAFRGAAAAWPSVAKAEGDAANVMIDGRIFRKIDSRSWDIERRLSDMEAEGVDFQVLSPMPELLSHWFEPDPAEALADIINADISRMVSSRPDRFAGIGMICAQDPARGARQLMALKDAGFHGIEIGSHINGVAIGSDRLWPIYEAAEALDLAIFVHPLHPVGVDRIGAAPEYAAVAAFPLETALAAVSLLAHGVLARFPKLRFLLSHGGGALPWILPRLEKGFDLSAALRAGMGVSPTELARRFWYDSILYSDDALGFLTDKVGRAQIVVGSDYPFAIMQNRPGEAAARVFREQAGALAYNADRLLGLRRGKSSI